ncbi:hypothetical protein JAAARDRAFT_29703 [Jaapia argillacea MUCL 33604]|uniref:N-alpha-acetyltransferase 40 n=1 Tax=Jaapia argillacea MUCL 33604 TaxID=933084 RepID=A0A067Q9N6_9AGAM|nr:hypothetical protein JAAARDRAFT_29703 [Jaapia argillacea MUCL 33604]
MHRFYTSSSFGWDPPRKRQELFHRLSRFILVRPALDESEEPRSTLPDIIAYSMFRFEREVTEDVVYCYELQVAKSAQRFGIGKVLMQQLAHIGLHFGMTRVMLTAFKSNIDACNFYRALGFSIDPTSPDYEDDAKFVGEGVGRVDYSVDDEGWEDEEDQGECDYVIMSKSIEE